MYYYNDYNDYTDKNNVYSLDMYRAAMGADGPGPGNPYDPVAAFPEALRVLAQAVMGETEDQLFYQYLINEAQAEDEKETIRGIRDNEAKHYKMFRQIYFELTGKNLPAPTEVSFEQPAMYCEGLKKALMGEQAAVTKYRKILYAMQNRRHINMITEIITDELRHLGLYNYLYARNGCRV